MEEIRRSIPTQIICFTPDRSQGMKQICASKDFRTAQEYTSALFTIRTKLSLCGHKDMVTEDRLIDKTRYMDLLSVLLAAETHRRIRMMNQTLHPVGAAPLSTPSVTPQETIAAFSELIAHEEQVSITINALYTLVANGTMITTAKLRNVEPNQLDVGGAARKIMGRISAELAHSM
ncbi:hypothetical protein BZG36_00285 [Bifiguratus adelaidae]|uniref:Uncharacterized protein n=1 Tax=Bifiguratus adelaidae TaxID=1938954 RepID=A0A261Y834_9FUNG|nr:hypothetical protein BZG36_00285 [Bifiguratus adelaidae]